MTHLLNCSSHLARGLQKWSTKKHNRIFKKINCPQDVSKPEFSDMSNLPWSDRPLSTGWKHGRSTQERGITLVRGKLCRSLRNWKNNEGEKNQPPPPQQHKKETNSSITLQLWHLSGWLWKKVSFMSFSQYFLRNETYLLYTNFLQMIAIKFLVQGIHEEKFT